eukprot:GHUV01034770.1.p1 GENE.GHUV01034770.1~~GHUV01034770.1.p1  ORF type:complete len:138 (+),score=11.13 GHUV01034770.1:102-515(+)
MQSLGRVCSNSWFNAPVCVVATLSIDWCRTRALILRSMVMYLNLLNSFKSLGWTFKGFKSCQYIKFDPGEWVTPGLGYEIVGTASFLLPVCNLTLHLSREWPARHRITISQQAVQALWYDFTSMLWTWMCASLQLGQ